MCFLPVYSRLLILTTYAFIPLTDFYLILSLQSQIVLGAQDDAYVFEANVDLTELLGDNTNVYVSVGDESLILKVDPHNTPELDTKITFSVPFANAYLFDGETEFVIAKK